MDERRYSVPSLAAAIERPASRQELASEDLHAWSIYRQNLNSDFADSALGAGEKSPLPYGNFQLRESTVSINRPIWNFFYCMTVYVIRCKNRFLTDHRS
jgi:hypothetical protein